ncbi:MAG: site-specific DNA-methyltransferase [Labilithrix sp.]|nr:site-specific DNA-methyltransferase [Labilithrix sp.]MCW5810575.1 site-specific DNA-methyltransferase [Labilithrix sp.]
MLVHGDNLPAMRRLARRFEGKVRCAYLDPPFNSGRSFVEYKDAKSADEWSAFMRPRIEALRPLLAADGAVFVEIDDTSLASLTTILDDVFGAKNRVSTITVVRSAPTGHKAQNRGPVHVSDFLLVYAKDKKAWRYRPQVKVRAGFDHAYSTWLDDPEAPPKRWSFRPLRVAVAALLGHDSTRAATKALGADAFRARVESIALRRSRHVVRFAQPRYEAIAQAAQAIVDRSRAQPDRVFVHERPGRPPFIVRGGNRILFLHDKVREIEGEPRIVEPLTNVWDDVPFQGIAREGGVVFSRNKKPERLVARVLAMSTDPGDWVLDPFLGSGTTAAVAHKMGRRWIGIESGDHLRTLAEPRLRRVIEGTDPTGVTSVYSFAGGGGFRVETVA